MLLGVRRFNALLVSFVFAFSALLLLRRLVYLTNTGGGEYQHADWLINYSDGLIRRGLSGEIFLRSADALAVSPLLLVSSAQAVLTLGLIVGLFVQAYRLGMSDRVTILLLSPALILFWVNDIGGAFRKELIGLAAFLPLLFAWPQRLRFLAVGSALVLFALAAFFHEGNIVLAPALALALYIRLGVPAFILPACVVGLSATMAALFAMTYLYVPDTEAMCQRLVDAGLERAKLCHGIFLWMDDTFSGNLDKVGDIIFSDGPLPAIVFLIIALLLFPGLAIAMGLLTSWKERLAFVGSVAFVFCLFPVATDWSRWVSMQVFAMTFLILILMDQRPAERRPIHKAVFGAAVAVHLGFGIGSIVPVPLEGFIQNVFVTVSNLSN